MDRGQLWRLGALLAMSLGVPVAACGGQVLGQGGHDAGAGSNTGGAPTSTGTQPMGSSTGTETGTATGTTTSTPTGSTTAVPSCTSSGTFGGFPCTAYTAFYYSCPPIAGTSGCTYVVPVVSGNPAEGWTNSTTQSEPVGAQMQVVAPTDTGGSTCEVITGCTCNSSAQWVKQNSGYGPCQ